MSFSASNFRAPGPHQLQPPLLLLRKGLLHKVENLVWLALPAVSPALSIVLQEHTQQQPLQKYVPVRVGKWWGYPADSEDCIQLFY